MSFCSLSAASRSLASMPACASNFSALSFAWVSSNRRLTFSAAKSSCGDVGSAPSREASRSWSVLSIANEYHHLSGSGRFFSSLFLQAATQDEETIGISVPLSISGPPQHFAHFCDDFVGLQRFSEKPAVLR